MTNDDMISRQNVLRCLTDISYNHCKTQGKADAIDIAKTMVITMPSAQPEPIKITIDHVPTQDELERLKQAMRNTPVILLPSAQPEITPDGTLNVTVDADIASVGRILLSQA